MNELQAKLLRRREINGEVNPESKIDNIPSIKVEDSDIKPLRISPKSKFPIQVKGPIQTFSPTTIPEIIQNSIVEPSAVNKPVRPKVVGLKPASFNKPESKELNTNQVIVKSAALIDETDTIPDMEVTVDTSNLAVFTTPTLVVNVSEPMKMVPQENVNEDISSHLLTHRDNVISFNASITESTSVPIASYTTVTSTSIVELQPSFPSPVANTTGTTSRSSLFDDDDDDEVFKRVIIKPVEENISNSSSFIEVNNKKLSTLRSSTDSESFDLSAVADAVKEVNNVVAGLEVPTGPRNIQDISINLPNAHKIHTDTVKSVTPQHITEMLLENERLIAKNAELERLIQARDNQIKTLLSVVDELRDLLSESARSPTNAHTYYKSPVLRARKSFGDGTLLNEPLFGDDEAEKLSSVQTRIQRKLDHLKFANVSDSTTLNLFSEPFDSKTDSLHISDNVLQGIDELLPSTAMGYSSSSAIGISEHSLVASSVFGGKSADESTSAPTELKSDPKEEFPNVASDDIYQEFVSKLMLHECKILVDEIRKFLESILGPYGDGQPPEPNMTVHPHGTPIVPYYGTKDIAARCMAFFNAMTETFKSHRLWSDASEEKLMSARDCLEKYVMTRVFASAWSGVRQESRDSHLSRRIKALRFLRPEHLDIKPCCVNESVWREARAELGQINNFKSPGDKVHCVVRCVSMLFHALANHTHNATPSSSSVSKQRSQSISSDDEPVAEPSKYGADDFLPVFIWIVLTSDVKDILSNCEYIQSYHSPYRLMSRAGYCLVNLQSAAEFIDSLDASSLSIDPTEFASKMKVVN